MLRKSQVEMVRDYISALNAGNGMVKQMIMGAGKTTVVCPLLTLMLGDGANLVIQVVPPALLDFSRAVMRSTFSSIMHKNISTLSFDRSTDVDSSIRTKLLRAKTTRGVIITTPTTVKSIMLKVMTSFVCWFLFHAFSFYQFLELMKMVTDDSIARNSAMESDGRELGKVLQIFNERLVLWKFTRDPNFLEIIIEYVLIVFSLWMKSISFCIQ